MTHYRVARAQRYKPFPQAPLMGAAALIAFALLLTASARLTGNGPSRPTAAALVERDLRFEDHADGSITVIDDRDGRTIDVIAPATNGFLRATLRGMALRRKFSGDTRVVFHLAAWADGRLTLGEPGSDHLIELEAFGRTNELAFARLLTQGSNR